MAITKASRRGTILVALAVLLSGVVGSGTPAWSVFDPPLSDTNGVTGGYTLTDLVTDNPTAVSGAGLPAAAHTDGNLVNPWGMASAPTSPIWVADNGTGVATLYNGSGISQTSIVSVPASANAGATSPAPVTGVAFNPSSADFNVGTGVTPAHFIFATEDGTIAGWNSGASAVMKVDNTNFTTGPVYKGLAFGTNANHNFIYATNFRTNKIDVFDRTFTKQTSGFSFTDPTPLPSGYAPFGIANIGSLLYVTYAVQNASKHDDVAGAGNGIVNVFDTAGTFLQRVATGNTLDSPWGLARAPVGFGTFSNDLLVGNFGDGRINAFDPSTFAFKGQLTDVDDNTVAVPGLWGLKFGNGGTGGSPGALFFTAGINAEADGLFGAITPAPTGPDFPATEGSGFARTITTFTDGDPSGTASQFSATIDWGDGATTSTSVVADPVNNGVFDVNGSHTYAEEGARTVTTKVTDSAGATLLATSRAVTDDASLIPGSTVTAQTFSGVGGTNGSTTVGSANAELNTLEAAIGGANDGTAPPEQTTGFRTINWDGVALDGTDFGGESTVIDSGHVVNVPGDRWQERGLSLDGKEAVSGPVSSTDTSTFADVNPSVDNLFPPFSPTKTFTPFNSNTATLTFVRPSVHGTTPIQQVTKGFGAIFRNVRLANTTSIEYFDGAASLGKIYAPPGSLGQAEFIGQLFDHPVVTKVVITLGTAQIFDFDGTSFSASNSDAPDRGVNLVAGDDLAYAEPSPTTTTTALHTNAHGKVNGIVGRFADLDANGAPSDYTATIDWGDGHRTVGTIAVDSGGGFDVEGTHIYRTAGRKSAVAHVADFGGSSLDLPFVVRVRR